MREEQAKEELENVESINDIKTIFEASEQEAQIQEKRLERI